MPNIFPLCPSHLHEHHHCDYETAKRRLQHDIKCLAPDTRLATTLALTLDHHPGDFEAKYHQASIELYEVLSDHYHQNNLRPPHLLGNVIADSATLFYNIYRAVI